MVAQLRWKMLVFLFVSLPFQIQTPTPGISFCTLRKLIRRGAEHLPPGLYTRHIVAWHTLEELSYSNHGPGVKAITRGSHLHFKTGMCSLSLFLPLFLPFLFFLTHSFPSSLFFPITFLFPLSLFQFLIPTFSFLPFLSVA